MQWDEYVMKSGPQHDKFWSDYFLVKRDILYVVASGFDPRMCDGIESISKKGGDGRRDCRLVRFYGPSDSTALSYKHLVEDNVHNLHRLKNWRVQAVELAPKLSRDIDIQRKAADIITDDDNTTYTDIIVDISSMPTQIFFPLLGKALQKLSENNLTGKRNPNLFVVVSEDTIIDRAINKMGLNEEAHFIYRFFGDMELQAKESGPSIWIPLLGENRADELNRLHQKIGPAETCPVIPSPSGDPRRGDAMLLEYRDMLRKIGIDPRNMIYASEQNPFDVYRQIRNTIMHYDRVLKPINVYRFAISPLSSKLMSIGAFLAAHELTHKEKIRPGIGLVSAKKYRFDGADEKRNPSLFTIWLHGDCYEP